MMPFVRSAASLAFVAVFAVHAAAHAQDAAAGAVAEEAQQLVRQLNGRHAEKAASRLADLGKDALAALKEALASKKWQVRYWAAYALAYSKAAKEGGGIEALKPLLGDKKRRVGLRAAMALFRLGDKSGLSFAKQESGSDKKDRRAEAFAALASSGDVELVPQLKGALSDRHPKVRYWALLGLRDLAGADALSLGLQYAKDRSPDVQTAAMEILSAQGKGKPEVERVLIGLLASKAASVRQQSASVLARIGTKAALGALRKVRDGDRSGDVRSVAEAAVVEIMKRLKNG